MKEHNENEGTCHVYNLMKIVIAKYMKIWLHYSGKLICEAFLDNVKGRVCS